MRLPLSLILASALAGCSTVEPTPVLETETPVQREVAASAKRIEELLLDLQQMRLPEAYALEPGAGITIAWNGDARDLLKRIAELRGLQLKVVGAPVVPLPIAVNEKNVPLEALLAKVASQTASRAWLMLENNVLTLEYRARTSL